MPRQPPQAEPATCSGRTRNSLVDVLYLKLQLEYYVPAVSLVVSCVPQHGFNLNSSKHVFSVILPLAHPPGDMSIPIGVPS